MVSLELPRAEWTGNLSEAFGRLDVALERKGTPIDDFDLAIAAHAVSLDAILATSNHSHFERIPELVVEDWLR